MSKFDVKALKQKAFASDDVTYDSIPIEEWGGDEYPVKTLVGGDLKKVMAHQNDPIRMTIMSVVYGCVTEDGERVFDNEQEAVAMFETKKGFSAISKLSKKIMEISGITGKANTDAKNA